MSNIHPSEFTKPIWSRFVRYSTHHWSKLNSGYIRDMSPLLVVYYESLVRKPEQELKRIVSFLYPDLLQDSALTERLQCVLQHKEGNFKRPRLKTSVFHDPFTETMKQTINVEIIKVRNLLLSHGYSDLEF